MADPNCCIKSVHLTVVGLVRYEMRLKRFFWIAAVAISLALVLVLVMARVVQRVISKPVVDLAQIVEQVAQKGDYSVRAATAESRDEVGTLIEGVNHMLAQIEQHKERLEQRVAERTAQLEAASQAKSRFLAQVSHELRTPLHGVLGICELLLRSALTSDQRRLVRTMRTAGEGFLALIDDLLDVSRIETGRPVEIRSLPFAPKRLVKEMCELFREEARAKDLELTCEVRADVPDALVGDPDRVRQILMNLMGNALKFTEIGQVQLQMGLADTGDILRCDVADTGVGIPAEAMERILQPFEQADQPNSRARSGIGLGLSISKDLAKRMGGDLVVASEPGRGTRVRLELPLQRADPGMVDLPAETAQIRLAGPAPRVLVVEDNMVNREVAEGLLRGFGCSVDCAANGHLAMEMFGRATYDLVLMDCQMPGLDGLEATRRIRRLEEREGRAPTPIVAATAYASQTDRQNCLAAGMDDYLAKPFAVSALAKVVARWTGRELRTDAQAPQAPGAPLVVGTAPFSEALERLRFLAERRGAEAAARNIATFRSSAAALKEELDLAIGNLDFVAAHRAAHSLKGAAGNMGIVELQDLCREIEEAAQAERLSTSGVVRLQSELARAWKGAQSAIHHLEETLNVTSSAGARQESEGKGRRNGRD